MLARQRSATSSVADESRTRISQSEAGIELTRALLETAELNLSYTVVTAPCDGYASRKNITVGQLVQPGTTLLDLVDTGELWVTANYKETQLRHIAPRQRSRHHRRRNRRHRLQRSRTIHLHSHRSVAFPSAAGQFSR